MSDFDLGLFLSGSNIFVASSEEEQGGGEPPFEALCVEQNTGYDLEVFWAIRGYSVSTSPQLDLVSWSPPLEYQVASRQHRCSGVLAGGTRGRRALLAVEAARAVQLAGPDHRWAHEAGHRRLRQRLGHDVRPVLPLSVRVRRNLGVLPRSPAPPRSSSRRIRRSSGSGQAVPHAQREGPRCSRPRQRARSGRAALPKPPDVVAPTATALVSMGRKGKALKLLATVSDDRRGQRDRARQARQQDGRDDQGEGLRSASSPRTIAVVWKVPVNAKGAYRHCVRAIDRATEPGELRESRPQIAGGGRVTGGGESRHPSRGPRRPALSVS